MLSPRNQKPLLSLASTSNKPRRWTRRDLILHFTLQQNTHTFSTPHFWFHSILSSWLPFSHSSHSRGEVFDEGNQGEGLPMRSEEDETEQGFRHSSVACTPFFCKAITLFSFI